MITRQVGSTLAIRIIRDGCWLLVVTALFQVIGNCSWGAPALLDAVRVSENWLSVALIFIHAQGYFPHRFFYQTTDIPSIRINTDVLVRLNPTTRRRRAQRARFKASRLRLCRGIAKPDFEPAALPDHSCTCVTPYDAESRSRSEAPAIFDGFDRIPNLRKTPSNQAGNVFCA
jgi:hypothetical protein